MARNDGRNVNQLRAIKITRGWLQNAEGSVLIEFGNTRVLCVASFTPGVPRWLKDSGNGWVTSEYADRKSTRLNSSHVKRSRMPSSA